MITNASLCAALQNVCQLGNGTAVDPGTLWFPVGVHTFTCVCTDTSENAVTSTALFAVVDEQTPFVSVSSNSPNLAPDVQQRGGAFYGYTYLTSVDQTTAPVTLSSICTDNVEDGITVSP